jgi:hypothetical protein
MTHGTHMSVFFLFFISSHSCYILILSQISLLGLIGSNGTRQHCPCYIIIFSQAESCTTDARLHTRKIQTQHCFPAGGHAWGRGDGAAHRGRPMQRLPAAGSSLRSCLPPTVPHLPLLLRRSRSPSGPHHLRARGRRGRGAAARRRARPARSAARRTYSDSRG